MSNHTPGPWKLTYNPYDDGTPYFRVVAGEGYYDTPDAPKGFNLDAICSPADAALIAAAPDLLAALKGAVYAADKNRPKYDYRTEECEELYQQCKRAIDKAEGSATIKPTEREGT